MPQIKRKRNVIDYCENKRKRKNNIENKKIISCFEDLSNEVLYEIFDYLDHYHIYQAFFHFNQRFQQLLLHSTIPIRIHLSSLTKSNFEDYYSNIITKSQHRIQSLYLSDLFMIEKILSPANIISNFLRLEILILEHIEFQHLQNILQYAKSLSNLHTLIIKPIDYIENSTYFYEQILALPALKSCTLSCKGSNEFKLLPRNNQQSPSPIEYFITNNSIDFDDFDNFLSYVPQLRHFSLEYLSGNYCKRTELLPMNLRSLTYLSIRIYQITFLQFEKLIKDSFNQVRHLHILASCDVTYVDAKRWEQLILSHLTNLSVFDMNYGYSVYNNNLSCDVLTENFSSYFWNERNTFFTYKRDRHGNIRIKIFYSIDPSRIMQYRLFKMKSTNSCPLQPKINLNYVDHLNLCNGKTLDELESYFPNVRQLTFDYDFGTNYCRFANQLNRIIPLAQITRLTIECYSVFFDGLLDILRFTSNLHTLECPLLTATSLQFPAVQQSEPFLYVANNNNIKTVNLLGKCGLDAGQFIVALFPRTVHLTIGMDRKELDLFLRFLLSKTNKNLPQLFYLCISYVPKVCLREVKKLIKSEKFLDNYLIKYVDRDLYLWW